MRRGRSERRDRLSFRFAAAFPVPALLKAVIACIVVAATSGPGGAVPPDPLRPFTAGTCEAAALRLGEALAGSPLISAAENETARALAWAQAEKLCSPEEFHDLITFFDPATMPDSNGD